jgi:universal stress protein E
MTDMNQGYKRILVAMDFSPDAKAALQQAVWLARESRARIVVAHTVPDLRRVASFSPVAPEADVWQGQSIELQREIRESADSTLRQLIVDLNATDLDVTTETFLGEPFVEITRAVQQQRYDLVLAGTRGMAAWEQFLVGSTAKRLIRKCPSSVWIVKAQHVGSPKAVLATTDFSEVSRRAVLEGVWVANHASAEFHLLHVVDSMDVPEDVISKIPKGSTLRNEINAEAQHRLDKFVDSLNTEPTKVHKHLSWGTPWKEIGRLAQQLNIDLLVMGTVGRTGLQGILLGNTAEKVLGVCDCSILTVKPADFVSPLVPAFA